MTFVLGRILPFLSPKVLFQPERVFVREATIQTRGEKKKPSKYHYFLFHDVLLQTAARKNKNGYICKRIINLWHAKAFNVIHSEGDGIISLISLSRSYLYL